MTAFYNENDPKAAAWLRELIARGLIAPGVVDERSILDIRPPDLEGFTQCHFFAGIGGWSYALRLAGWPDDRPVWTGSPPCQPFSAAGKGLARGDARHLAPHFAQLVGAARPGVLFGEQVASAAVFGKAAKRPRGSVAGAPEWAWFDDLCDRLESARYAVGASDIPAAGVGAPHIRQRCFFGAIRLADAERGMADADDAGCGELAQRDGEPIARREARKSGPNDARRRDAGGMGDALGARLEGLAGHVDGSDKPGWHDALEDRPAAETGADCGVADADGADAAQERASYDSKHEQRATVGRRPVEPAGARARGGDSGGHYRAGCGGVGSADGVAGVERPCAAHGGWGIADWLFCRDGKWRPVEPGAFPLAHGISERMVRLRGYGNAINPQAGAEFVAAFSEAAGI